MDDTSATETRPFEDVPSGALGTDAPVAKPARRERLVGIDVARALAILGMVTVHFGPHGLEPVTLGEKLYGSFYGKASLLFVLVAGVGVGLLEAREPAATVRARLVYRATWLIPLGVWLQALEHPVAVILQYYGAYFLVLAPFVGRRSRTLLAAAAIGALVGGALVLMTRQWAVDWLMFERGDPPLGLFGEVVLGGYYPLVTWVPPMLFGLWLARLALQRTAVQLGMVVVGAATLAATVALSRGVLSLADASAEPTSWWFALSTRGHTQMPLAVLGGAGFAVAIIGASLLVARWSSLAAAPLAAAGRLALTIYVGHLLVFDWFPDLFPADTVTEGVVHVVWFGVVTSAGALAWLAVFPYGPLEGAVRWPWRRLVLPLLAPHAGTWPPDSGTIGTPPL